MRTAVAHARPSRSDLFLSMLALLILVAAGPVRAQDQSDRAPWLGVYTQALTSELRDGLGAPRGGVLVNRVVVDSPADRAGLRKGDVILSVNSRSVDSPGELSEIVGSLRSGQTVSLRISRDGERQTLSARLAARPRQGELETPETLETLETPEAHEEPALPDRGVVPKAPKAERDRDYFFNLPDHDMSLMPMGRGRLGVRVESLSGDLGSYFDTPGDKGVLVVEVLKDTPGERAGLKAGDVITRVGDRDVYDSGDLVEALGTRDGRVELTVIRRGSRRTVEAELEAAPRTQRMRRGEGMMGLRDRNGTTWSFGDSEDVRRELRELREQLKQLRSELEELKRN